MTPIEVTYNMVCILKNHNINVIAHAGTLMGFCRDYDIMPHDKGGDFMVNLNRDNNKIIINNEINPKLKSDLETNGFFLIKKTPRIINNKLRLLSLRRDDRTFDIWCFMTVNNKYYEDILYGSRLGVEFLDNLVEIRDMYKGWHHDFSFLIPEHAEKLLDGIYNNEVSRKTSTKGNWRIPCKMNEITENCSASPHYIFLNDDMTVTAECWISLKSDFKPYQISQEYLDFII